PGVGGEGGRLAAVAQARLGRDAAHVGLHRLFGQHQVLGDLGVGPASGDEGEDLRLAFGQALEPQGGPAAGGGTLLGEVRDEAARHGGGEEGVARGHHPYGGDEVGGRRVLQQEAARARPQRLVHVVV